MEAENEEVPATGPSTPTENHNHNRVRRRNVPEQSASLGADATSDRVPLVALPDLTKAWYDGVAPRIPDHVGADVDAAAGKRQRNGVLAREDDRGGATDASASAREKMKLSVIRGSIANPDLTLGELRLLGCSSEGFVNGTLPRRRYIMINKEPRDDVRRVLWPKLLRLSRSEPTPVDGLETVHKYIPNEIYQQIQKDVARSGSHISQSATEQETECFQEQLTQLMCWVLHRHSQLNYYQGYNDVAATVLLVVGLQAGVYVLERISLQFLERFMEKTMEKVNQELFYIFALLERVHPTLLEHLENVELFPHFALAEYTTWYAHKYAENRKLLHRLFDFFLGSPPLMPLYLSTVIVAHRATEIFNTTPDMGHTHKVLCTLPDDLPFETLLVEAKNLYRQYPPESITNDVKDYDHKRKIKEQEWKAKAEASRQERERQRKLKIVQATPRISYRIRSYKTITVVTILALGIYAFIRSSTGLN